MEISFDAMRFGTENDLKIALTELRWIKKIKGKLRNSDFVAVSEKYKFPVDFLKKGLEGFSHPDDYLISKSKWFPILYSWVVQHRQFSLNLYKLQFDYYRTRFRSRLFMGLFILIALQVESSLRIFFGLDLLQSLLVVLFPLALSLIALYVEFSNHLSNKKIKMNEYKALLEGMGLRRIIDSNEDFIRRHFKYVIFASNILLKKIQFSSSLTLIPLGVIKQDKKPSRFHRFTRRLSRKPAFPDEKEMIPWFYAESHYIEYRKRIENLAGGGRSKLRRSVSK